MSIASGVLTGSGGLCCRCFFGGPVAGPEGDVVLDFSSVRRIDSNALPAIEELARIADEKSVKVALRGVNVDIYKVLKLLKLSRRFSFVN